MSSEIRVTVDGVVHAVARGSRAGDLLKLAANGVRPIAARVNGRLMDLGRPVTEDATVEPVSADSPDGIEILRHSTAHLMAQAVQSLYPGTQVTIGPTIEDGFYYDFAPSTPFHRGRSAQNRKQDARTGQGRPEGRARRSEPRRGYPALRLDEEKYKVEIIQGIPDPQSRSISQGDWVDLCRGPHVPSTRHLKAFKLTSVAGAYWRGDEHNAMLSRIYGTAFASKEALEEHLRLLEMARTRDHRKLGREMGLFFFDPIAPGSPFFLPKGAIIYNELIDYVRRLYRRYGFEEVITPQIFKNQLWRTSGHWEMFRENMFLTTDGENHRRRSWTTASSR